MLKIKKISDYLTKSGQILTDTNVYIVSDEKDAAIIDCGGGIDRAIEYIRKSELNLKYIILTHSHFDHIYYLDKLKEEFKDAKVVASHNMDIKDLDINLLYSVGENNRKTDVDIFVKDKDELYLNKAEKSFVDKDIKERLDIKAGDEMVDFSKDEAIKFVFYETPGHTPDSICIYLIYGNKKYLFSGDTIFKDGVGRSDFYGGSSEYLRASLRKLKRIIQGDAIVFPGHGENTVFRDWKDVFRLV